MNLSVPSEGHVDLIALCRRWHDENRAMADDLLARRTVHSELVAGEWLDVSTDDADRHARVAAELELLVQELEASDNQSFPRQWKTDVPNIGGGRGRSHHNGR